MQVIDKQAKHTPGPWRIARDYSPEHGETPYIVDGAGKNVAMAAYMPTEQGANARLIAAAPDLLAALEAAVLWYETAPIAEREAVEVAIEQDFPVVEARAAIAKAKG